MRKRLGIGAAALIALTGCGDSTPKAGEETPAAKVAEQVAAVKIDPGMWETSHEIVSVEAPGVPPGALKQMIGKQTSVRNCVTPEQAANPQADVVAQKQNGCTYRDFSMAGGRISGTMSCAAGPAGTVESAISGTYGPRAYEMDMEMKTDAAGMTMTIKARTSGKRVGECA